MNGVRYTKLSFDAGPAFDGVALESFALPAAGRVARRINAALRRDMPRDPRRGDWLGCVIGGLTSSGGGGGYTAVVRPTLITPRWLVAERSIDSYCGGAHANEDVNSLTFDRTTGSLVDLDHWLNGAAVERRRDGRRTIVTVRAALREAIIARAGAIETECQAPVKEAEYWDIGLVRAGLRFTPEFAHYLAACANPVLVPWAALAPFLGPDGRAGAAMVAPAGRLRPRRPD